MRVTQNGSRNSGERHHRQTVSQMGLKHNILPSPEITEGRFYRTNAPGRSGRQGTALAFHLNPHSPLQHHPDASIADPLPMRNF